MTTATVLIGGWIDTTEPVIVVDGQRGEWSKSQLALERTS
jgi:hypothetical protein